jgi:hypothetical protein
VLCCEFLRGSLNGNQTDGLLRAMPCARGSLAVFVFLLSSASCSGATQSSLQDPVLPTATLTPAVWKNTNNATTNDATIGTTSATSTSTNATETTVPPRVEMNWRSWLTVGSVFALLLSLSLDLVNCCSAMVVITLFFYLCGIITLTDLYAGLSSTSVISIALLFICVDPIADLPIVQKAVIYGFRGTRTGGSTALPLFKIILFCLATSSFFNNAPQVALLTNLIKVFCRENNLFPSQFLMPMNFATLVRSSALSFSSHSAVPQPSFYACTTRSETML